MVAGVQYCFKPICTFPEELYYPSLLGLSICPSGIVSLVGHAYDCRFYIQVML